MKFHLSCKQYGQRRFNHFDAYHLEPGWLFLELGSWTLEVFYTPAPLPKPIRRLFAKERTSL